MNFVLRQELAQVVRLEWYDSKLKYTRAGLNLSNLHNGPILTSIWPYNEIPVYYFLNDENIYAEA